MGQGRSRIDIRDVTAKSRAMPSIRFDVLLTVGVTEWGPMYTATPVLDYSDFVEKYGNYIASYHTAIQVKSFFDNGGKRAIISRTCATTVGAPTSALKATGTLVTAGGLYGVQNTLTVDGLYYGARGNGFTIKIQAATNGEASRFDLLVYEDGIFTGEWFRNLVMTSTDDRYAIDVVNTLAGKSTLIYLTDLAASGSASDKRPVNVAAATLTTGNDGLAGLADADFSGSASYNTGLYAFNLVEDGDLLCVPDRATTTLQNAAISYCATEKKGKVIFITDPPASSDKAAIVVHAQALTASEARTGVYWPRIKVVNPDKAIYGKADTITIAPSCSLAGTMAKNSEENEAKYFVQPGNEVFGLLPNAVGLETETVLEPTTQDWVTDFGINPIVAGIRVADGNYGVWTNDVQAGKTSGNFKSVGEIHGVAYLRKMFERYLERHRTQANTEERRRDIKAAFEAELMKWTAAGAFATKKASEAFYVNTDPLGVSLNNALVQEDEKFRCLVGLATARAMRFMELMFTRDNRAVESYIQQQMSATT